MNHTDTRPALATAMNTAAATIAAIRHDQLDNPTPCSEFDVRHLLGHLTMVPERLEAAGLGRDPMSVDEHVSLDDDAWLAGWTERAARVEAAWVDEALLDREFVFPWATLPGAATLMMYTSEITVHTWDLARATGQTPAWDADVVAAALAFSRQILPVADRTPMWEGIRASMPEHMRDFTPPYASAVEVADEAPLIEQLVAWNGRQP